MSVQEPDPSFVKILAQSPAFREWPEDALRHLLGEGRVSSLSAGANVFQHGDHGDELYVVLRGAVDIHVPTDGRVANGNMDGTADGAQALVLDRREAGQWFGEIACLLERGKRTATVTAATSCKLAVVSRARLMDTLARHPGASLSLIRQLALRVQWHTDHLSGLVQPSDQRRVDSARRTPWQWCADGINWFFAQWWVSLGHILVWAVWLVLPYASGWDDHKRETAVTWLTNIVSLEAIVLSIAILVAQRRKEEKDQSRDDVQYTNTHVAVLRTQEILQRIGDLEKTLKDRGGPAQ